MDLKMLILEQFSDDVFELIRKYQGKFDLDYNESNMTINISYVSNQKNDVVAFLRDAEKIDQKIKVTSFDKANMNITLKVS